MRGHKTGVSACPECGSPVPEPFRGNGVSYRLARCRYLWRIVLAGIASAVFVGLSSLAPGIGGSLTNVADFHAFSLFVYALDTRYVVTTEPRDRVDGRFLDDDPREFNLLVFLNEDVWVLVPNPRAKPWHGVEIAPWGRSHALVVDPRVVRWFALAGLLPMLVALTTGARRSRRRREHRCRRCGYLDIGDMAECPLCHEVTGHGPSRRPGWAGSFVVAAIGTALFVGLGKPGDRTQSLGLWARIHDIPLNVFALKQCLIFTTRPRAWDLEPDELEKYRDEEAELIRALIDDSFPMPWYGVQTVPWKGSTATVLDRSHVRWAALIFAAPLLVTAMRRVSSRRPA